MTTHLPPILPKPKDLVPGSATTESPWEQEPTKTQTEDNIGAPLLGQPPHPILRVARADLPVPPPPLKAPPEAPPAGDDLPTGEGLPTVEAHPQPQPVEVEAGDVPPSNLPPKPRNLTPGAVVTLLRNTLRRMPLLESGIAPSLDLPQVVLEPAGAYRVALRVDGVQEGELMNTYLLDYPDLLSRALLHCRQGVIPSLDRILIHPDLVSDLYDRLSTHLLTCPLEGVHPDYDLLPWLAALDVASKITRESPGGGDYTALTLRQARQLRFTLSEHSSACTRMRYEEGMPLLPTYLAPTSLTEEGERGRG